MYFTTTTTLYIYIIHVVYNNNGRIQTLYVILPRVQWKGSAPWRRVHNRYYNIIILHYSFLTISIIVEIIRISMRRIIWPRYRTSVRRIVLDPTPRAISEMRLLRWIHGALYVYNTERCATCNSWEYHIYNRYMSCTRVLFALFSVKRLSETQ